MPLQYQTAEREGSLPIEEYEGTLLDLFVAFANEKAPASAKKKLKLGRGATLLQALASVAQVDPADLKPLSLMSSGCYSEDDYLGDLEEYEIEEYGHNAKDVVADNLAAWQPPDVLLRALTTAINVLNDPAMARLLLPELIDLEPCEALRHLQRAVEEAISLHATSVCFELAYE